MRIGEILRKWRISMELTQKEVALQMKITPSTLCRLEKDGSLPGARALAKILNFILSEAK